jgi:hypothetical protein
VAAIATIAFIPHGHAAKQNERTAIGAIGHRLITAEPVPAFSHCPTVRRVELKLLRYS